MRAGGAGRGETARGKRAEGAGPAWISALSDMSGGAERPGGCKQGEKKCEAVWCGWHCGRVCSGLDIRSLQSIFRNFCWPWLQEIFANFYSSMAYNAFHLKCHNSLNDKKVKARAQNVSFGINPGYNPFHLKCHNSLNHKKVKARAQNVSFEINPG